MANPQVSVAVPAENNNKRIRVEVNPVLSPPVDLPYDILESVFSFLPIRDAIQVACNVNTRFMRSWRQNRKFLFGRDFARRYTTEDLISIVDHLFECHNGPQIQSFQLYIDPVGYEHWIENWLEICVEKDLQDLEFYFFQPGFPLEPEFLNALTKLRTLKLVNCGFRLPRVLTGLRFLQTLVLWHLGLTEETLEVLVFHCKLLKVIDLFRCSGIRRINILARTHRQFKMLKIACCYEVVGIEIDSPTLRSVFYCGVIPNKIVFAPGVALLEACFNFTPSRNYIQATQVEILVNHFHHVSVLTTSAIFLEALVAKVRNGQFREPQYHLGSLKELQLFMEGGMFCNPYDIAVFLRNCPSLERLFIDLNDYHFECGMYWELHQKHLLNNFNHYFTRLRIVKLKGYKFLPAEIVLAKLLLEKAIFLELLILITPRNGRTRLYPHEVPFYRGLFDSWKASPKAQILLHEHVDDHKSCIRPSHPKYWY